MPRPFNASATATEQSVDGLTCPALRPPSGPTITVDANEAVASVAHRLSEVAVIYPITPSSPMGEFVDEWASKKKRNLWGAVPEVVEMQSEAGAAGAVHGVLQAGSLATTFTASQGLLLMLPNMYKIAGELLPFVMHVAARTVATHALSIFGDHSDVMAVRQAGFTMLCSNSVQEAQDMAAVAHALTLRTRVPVLHFFDGFRTSHEVQKIEVIEDATLREMIDDDLISAFRSRALSPDHPVIRGTAQNPDTFFQAREAGNLFYDAIPVALQDELDRFAELTGRQYGLFDYEGHPDAERVIVIMGSGAETVASTVKHLVHHGEKVGVLKVRLYRPFSVEHFIEALPPTVSRIAVLDRTKEPGAVGEPLYLDVVTALREAEEVIERFDTWPKVVGGRYGLSSKEFTPAMVRAVFDELRKAQPKNHFTIGILDDVTHTSLPWDPSFDIEPANVFRAVFYGLGSDGTVGANKNTIKIIGDETDLYAQGYFVYDSKKSGAMTISHLRFGPSSIRSPWLIGKAKFIGCHQPVFVERLDPLELAEEGAVFLLNTPSQPAEAWSRLPRDVQQTILDKRIALYVIDALSVAREAGMGGRINTIMQTCFFAISGILPREEAIAKIKKAIEKTYGRKGRSVVEKNWAAVDATLAHLHRVEVPADVDSLADRPPVVPLTAPDFVQRVTGQIMAGRGDLLPVSAFPVDGTWPTDTAQWEKRGIAAEIPVWQPELCIQCNKCALVCPHAAIRVKAYDPGAAVNEGEPETFRSMDYKAKDLAGTRFTVQVAPDDCTGCSLCVMVCPSKDKADPSHKALNMDNRLPHLETERANWAHFLDLPELRRDRVVRIDAKGSQFFEPLFEFSGACAACGETPYIKLLTQLFGDRMLIANATGCSSIFGGNLPTTPYRQNAEGRGPAWCNSLFEDNAEFGYGLRVALDAQTQQAWQLLRELAPLVGEELVERFDTTDSTVEANLTETRDLVATLRRRLRKLDDLRAQRLDDLADALTPRSIWLIGGDGWAYDIGYGGLDHVLAQHRNVNVLVLDTEVYSNTGGQASKATPLGAAARFASAGKRVGKKDLGLMAMSYGHVYVASVAIGANDNQTVKAIREAEAHPGPSLVIAYAHCNAHGYELKLGLEQQKLAVSCGMWPLYRYDPRRAAAGQPPLQIDSPPIKGSIRDYLAGQTRFTMVEKADPQAAARLAERIEHDVAARAAFYRQLAAINPDPATD